MIYSRTSEFDPLNKDPDAYREADGSPRFSTDRTGVTAIRVFRVKGQYMRLLKAALKGVPQKGEPPDVYHQKEFAELICTRVSAEPWDRQLKVQDSEETPKKRHGIVPFTDEPSNAHMSYEWWRVTATYETPPPVEISASGQYLALRPEAYVWEGESLRDGSPPLTYSGIGVMLPGFEVSLSLQNVRRFSVQSASKFLGGVNSAEVSLTNLLWRFRERQGIPRPRWTLFDSQTTFAAGTLMLTNLRAPVLHDFAGFPYWEVQMQFMARPDFAPWNMFFDSRNAVPGASLPEQWKRVVYEFPDGSQTPFQPAPEVNFTDLFLREIE